MKAADTTTSAVRESLERGRKFNEGSLEFPRSSIVRGVRLQAGITKREVRLTPDITSGSRLRTKVVHRSPIGDRAARLDVHVEGDRLELRRPDFDLVRTGFEVGLLCHAVEVVDDADEVAVDIHLGITLRQVDP